MTAVVSIEIGGDAFLTDLVGSEVHARLLLDWQHARKAGRL